MDPMNPKQDPLLNLKDIHLPELSPWWDLAVGWWILLALLVVLCIWGVPKLKAYWHRQRSKRLLKADIHARLNTLCQIYQTNKDAKALLADINILLKQVVMTVFPERHAAHLTGTDWLAFLDSLWVDIPKHLFADKPIADVFCDGAYRPAVDVDEKDIQVLCDTVKAWLKVVSRHV